MATTRSPLRQVLQIVQLFRQTAEIAHSIAIIVVKSPYVSFIYYRVFVPKRISL